MLFGALFVGSSTYGQCRQFLKKKCVTDIDGQILSNRYVVNDLFQGESVDLNIPFYGGQVYALSVCTEEAIENGTSYKIFNDEDELLFASNSGTVDSWKFELESFQVLRVELSVNNTENKTQDVSSGLCCCFDSYF